MNIKSASIVLIGLCNEEPLLQTLIGEIVLRRSQVDEKLEPRLIKIVVGETEGTPSSPFALHFVSKHKGVYHITCSIHGDTVLIMLDAPLRRYRFVTGFGGKDLGTSGPICNGGNELATVLDELFFPGQ